jgi:hypothetical protein
MPVIQIKRKSSAELTNTNPTPASGEFVVEDTGSGYFKFKVGDDVTPWNSLYYPLVHTRGDNSLSGVQDFSTGVLSRANLRNYSEFVTPLAIVDSGLIIDLNSGNVFRVSLETSITGVIISNPRPSGTSHSFSLVLDYISSGRSVVWPTGVGGVLWNGGSGAVPLFSSGVGRSATLSFLTTNGGNSYLGFIGGTNFGV